MLIIYNSSYGIRKQISIHAGPLINHATGAILTVYIIFSYRYAGIPVIIHAPRAHQMLQVFKKGVPSESAM